MIGRTLGKFRVLEQLGAGGMGVVYRARDERLERNVALKVLPVGLLANENARKRFRNEALTLAKLSHPNIGMLFDFDSFEGVDFLVMECIPGTTLAARIAEGPLTEKEVARLGGQIASALQEAHEHGVVHRDLKPGNVLLTPKGEVKVLDFGLAKLLLPGGAPPASEATADALSHPQSFAGTLPYMAPEQLRGGASDARTDIFALGNLLYEMATSRRAFNQTLPSRLMDDIVHQPPPAPRTLNGGLSQELQRIILKCLEKDPEDRYQSAKEISVDLRRLDQPKVSSAARPPVVFRTRRRAILVLAGFPVLALALAVVFLNLGGWRERFLHLETPQIQSLAVLPLENLSRDPDQEFFADGMTEALIANLAKISSLRVISRTSAMSYKGARKPLPEIARELHVDAVVEGTVQRSGDHVRVSAQLLDAANDRHLWQKEYDRDARDILTLESEVAQAIAGEIRVRLTPEEKANLSRIHTVDPEAHLLYLRGRYFWNKRTEESLAKGLEYFEGSIEKDPTFALGYVGIADTYAVYGYSGYLAPQDAYPKAVAAARKALEIDDSLGEAYATLGHMARLYDWDWPEGERDFKRSIELNPNYAPGRHWYSHLLADAGRFDESLAESKKVIELDPLDSMMAMHLGWHYFMARQYSLAAAQLQATLQPDPNFFQSHIYLGEVYEQQGNVADAIAEFQKATKLRPGDKQPIVNLAHAYGLAGRRREAQDLRANLVARAKREYVSPFDLALIEVGLGDKNSAFARLEESFRDRSLGPGTLARDPRFDSLRSDPRYAGLLRRTRVSF